MKKLIAKLMQFFYDIKELHETIKANQEFQRRQHIANNESYLRLIEGIKYKSAYDELLEKFNEIINLINKKGGQRFLDEGILPEQAAPQFTKEEIKTLIQLCHPDKHGGKESAVEMTKKLNIIRDSL